MNAILEQEPPVIRQKPDRPVFSNELAELIEKAQQRPKPVEPEPPVQRRATTAPVREPYGWD